MIYEASRAFNPDMTRGEGCQRGCDSSECESTHFLKAGYSGVFLNIGVAGKNLRSHLKWGCGHSLFSMGLEVKNARSRMS
ncbi:hypothetical protein BDN67DRAFT_57458 [Paxillus ammoniavirescens]|nr:hypothetical protein BDN67DRAFT_57458 [Paxillus ammoniavirescens]